MVSNTRDITAHTKLFVIAFRPFDQDMERKKYASAQRSFALRFILSFTLNCPIN